MKALFLVFTGTGNTLRVCIGLLTRWREMGNEGDLALIRKGSECPDPRGYDTVIVGYPVHAFNAPAPVLKFLKKLPVGEQKPVYLVRTSGEPLKLNDASGITPRRILKKRGYTVRGEFHYVMPYNIIFRHSEEMATRMWRDAEILMDRDVKTIAAGEGEIKRVNAFRRMVAFTLRIEHTAMPCIGKTFKVKKKHCIGCGVCEKLCPQGNIRMKDDKPKFGGHCVGCMACAFACPMDAVRISLLNGWRVNGKYEFNAAPATDEEVCKYCRKAYLKYFRATEMLAAADAGTDKASEVKE